MAGPAFCLRPFSGRRATRLRACAGLPAEALIFVRKRCGTPVAASFAAIDAPAKSGRMEAYCRAACHPACFVSVCLFSGVFSVLAARPVTAAFLLTTTRVILP